MNQHGGCKVVCILVPALGFDAGFGFGCGAGMLGWGGVPEG